MHRGLLSKFSECARTDRERHNAVLAKTGKRANRSTDLSHGASAHEMYDFQTVAFFEASAGPLLAGNNPLIQFDCDAVGFHAQLEKQPLERQRNRAVAILTIDLNFHLRCHLISEAWAVRDAEKTNNARKT